MAALECDAHAMTDITGYGLLGHGTEMVARSEGVDFWLGLNALSFLPGAVEYATAGIFPGGMGNNRQYFSQWVDFADGIEQVWKDLLFTPETSGGLLIAMDPRDLSRFQSQFGDGGVVGRVAPGNGRLRVERQVLI